MAKINEFQRWPTDKDKYDKNYLRLFGIKCSQCDGSGILTYDSKLKKIIECGTCKGLGYKEKK